MKILQLLIRHLNRWQTNDAARQREIEASVGSVSIERRPLLEKQGKREESIYRSRSPSFVTYLSVGLITPLLLSAEPSLSEVPPLNHKLPKKSFTYMNAGVTTWAPIIFDPKLSKEVPLNEKLSYMMPDLSLGARSLSTHHVFDRAIGIAAQAKTQLLYVQGSYLFYPVPSKHIYFGAGLTCGVYRTEEPWIPSPYMYLNLPITIGYQFPSKTVFQFVQVQATPLATGTISYGIGF